MGWRVRTSVGVALGDKRSGGAKGTAFHGLRPATLPPGGRLDNSPAFQHWEKGNPRGMSPGGTIEASFPPFTSAVPLGLKGDGRQAAQR